MTNGNNPNVPSTKPSTQPGKGTKKDLEDLGKTLKVLSLDELKKLKETLTEEQFEALKAQIEKGNSIHEEYYKVGSSQCDNPIEATVEKVPLILVGKVDHTGYKMKWHEADWYDPFIKAATEFSAFYEKSSNIFDESTKKNYDRLKPAIDLFKTLGTYDKKEFNKKYKREIWNLVKTEGAKSVYGKEGVLNFLLAYRRITSLYPDLKNVTKDDFDISKFSESKIKLVFGTGEGKEERQKDRKAYIIMKKKEEEKKVPPVVPNKPDVQAPETQPEPGKPEKKPGQTLPEPDKNPDEQAIPEKKPDQTIPEPDKKPDEQAKKFPDLGTDEFYEKYDIAEEDREDFNDKIGLFKAWIEDEKKMALLTKDTFVEDLKKDPEMMKEYFNDEGTGLLDDLSKHLMEFEDKYVDFFTDMENPLADQIRNLHELVLVQILSHIDKKVESSND